MSRKKPGTDGPVNAPAMDGASMEREAAGRLPPYNRDAERSVLGSMLRDKLALSREETTAVQTGLGASEPRSEKL